MFLKILSFQKIRGYLEDKINVKKINNFVYLPPVFVYVLLCLIIEENHITLVNKNFLSLKIFYNYRYFLISIYYIIFTFYQVILFVKSVHSQKLELAAFTNPMINDFSLSYELP